MPARDICLKNSQVYEENGDPIYGTLEASFTLVPTYNEVERLLIGNTSQLDSWKIEVNLTVTATNAALKYYIMDEITNGKTPVLNTLIGEHLDKETGNKETWILKDIRLTPESLEFFKAEAAGNGKATYAVKGVTNVKPDRPNEFPEYTE